MVNRSIVIDTNLLLDDSEIIFKLGKRYDEVIIPLTVLKELDKHKRNKDLAYSARSAINSILAFKQSYPNKLVIPCNDREISTNDEFIIQAASENHSVLATKDIAMSVISEAKNVTTKLYGILEDRLHEPFIYINSRDLGDKFTFEQKYMGSSYLYLINKLKKLDNYFNLSDWMFINLTTDEDDMLYVNNPKERSLVRIDNLPKYRDLYVNKDIKLSAKDFFQIAALYILEESPNTLLTGKWGSGKTLLATAYALSKSKDRKIFITRPPIGIDNRYDIGALPGNKNEKMIEWFSGILSAMYYLYANTRGQEGKDNVTYDFVKDELFRKKFEVIPINAIQGLSLLDGDILIVDECQLVSVDYFSMILSRASEGSKVIMLGDYKQTYNVVRPSESGLLKLCRLLPHEAISHVDLKISYRSKLTELADSLADKSI